MLLDIGGDEAYTLTLVEFSVNQNLGQMFVIAEP